MGIAHVRIRTFLCDLLVVFPSAMMEKRGKKFFNDEGKNNRHSMQTEADMKNAICLILTFLVLFFAGAVPGYVYGAGYHGSGGY